jgi:hypothetical protein
MPKIGTVEFTLGEFLTFSGVLDAVISTIDHYSRWEFVANLQQHIPIIGHPITPVALVVIGLILINRSNSRLIKDAIEGTNRAQLAGADGKLILNVPKGLGVATTYAVIGSAILLAVAISIIWLFTHKLAIPQITQKKIYVPPICKTVDCFPQKPKSTRPTINAPFCPNGICPTAPNYRTQTVNNGPPPVKFDWRQQSIDPPDLVPEKRTAFKYEQRVVVHVNERYSPVSVGVICDGPISEITGGLAGVAEQIGPLEVIDANDNKKGAVYWQGSPGTPQQPIIISIWSNEPFKVLDVVQANINH